LKLSKGGKETPPALVVLTLRMRTLTCSVSGGSKAAISLCG
jgi:hypothetical protein